jgi:hypothetical protein
VAVQPAMVVGASSPHGPAALPAVVASVQAARRKAPIPSPLVPSILGVDIASFGAPSDCDGQDGHVTRSAICYLSGPTAAPSSTPTPGNKTLVVFGDERAAMWISPLLEMAGEDHWDIVPMWKRGCTGSVLYANSTAINNLAECQKWYAWALKTIARLHPDAVFNSFLTDYSGDTATKVETGLSSLMTSENHLAKHVVLMLQSPYLSSLPRPVDCLHKSGATLRTCTGAWRGTPLQVSEALRARARLDHAGVIDPVGWFCYKGLCPLAIGHTAAFADYGIVSTVYAIALSPPFRAAFRAALHPTG